MEEKRLSAAFFQRPDVVAVARELLGKVLITQTPEGRTAGMIVETEAYAGDRDRACHAYPRKRTPRTALFFEPGGRAYVYLCYGIHHLFNIVTNVADEPDAVLVRAVAPVEGVDLMLARRGLAKVSRRLTGGPGVLSQALGITTAWNGEDLQGPRLWLEDRGERLAPGQVMASPRVGVDYAGEDALLPWRFRVKDSPFTSPAP